MTDHRMATVPLTTTVRSRAESRAFGLLTVGAALALGLAAYGSSGEPAHIKAWDYDTATEAGAAEVLADEERVITMSADIDDVQGECAPASGGDTPASRLERNQSSSDDYLADATIQADQWTEDQEQAATLMCG